MNEFNLLRARALKKRNEQIAKARDDYNHALQQIAKIEQELTGKEDLREARVTACIESVIPSDRPFNTQDILNALEAKDSSRVWRMHSIHNHLYRLREKGIIERIKKPKKDEPATYVRAGLAVHKHRFADMTFPQVMREMLTRPMTPTELLVAILEEGYVSTMTKTNLRNHLTRELQRGKFVCSGGKWVCG